MTKISEKLIPNIFASIKFYLSFVFYLDFAQNFINSSFDKECNFVA
ncbi:metal-sulfur cluster biosynthesis protein [Campylobacter concisus]|nr:metal-sulfur cluster biosynthesis protein [Campylobacter concisus]OUT13180.1 metal-sulfur cluster biosynthesis protein [Campylobacter concisus]